MNGYITTREAKKILKVNEDTLRRWADSGKIPFIRTPGGQRLYDVQQYFSRATSIATPFEPPKTQENSKESICYCRVSSQGQKDDLKRQIAYMQERFPSHRIVSDVGSGINFKRRGLRTVLEMACKRQLSQVVVAYRDRLCRFAFELFEWIFLSNGVQLVVLNESVESSEQAELAEDLLAIINVFNCRVNGRRKYTKKETFKEDRSTEEGSFEAKEDGSKCDEEGEIKTF